jgi:hypothetical protein
MATNVTPTNIQKMEFDVTTAEGAGRVTVVTGIIQFGPQAFSNSTSTTLADFERPGIPKSVFL